MRVLAASAHPDDLEILCAGSLVRLARAGHEVVMCHATVGNLGSHEETAEDLPRMRVDEARAAARIIGAEHRTLGWRDYEINASDPTHRLEVVELIRQVKPDVVVTHDPNDYQTDHTEMSRLVFDATLYASLPLLKTRSKAHTPVPPVYYMDPVHGLGGTPSFFVDISSEIDRKEQALLQHKSQIVFLEELGSGDIVDAMRTLARLRGYQSGVAFAEGFTVAPHAFRVKALDSFPGFESDKDGRR